MNSGIVKSSTRQPQLLKAPEPSPCVRAALARLRQRYAAGEAVSLAEAMAAAGLSPQERHVVGQRLRGRSFAEIAADAEMSRPDGRPYARQRLHQFEAEATRKLGLPGSVEHAVLAVERAEQAFDLAERGERIQADDLHGDRGRPPSWKRVPPWEREHEARVRAFLRSRAG